ncbi:MAG: hypothetical protein M2R46_01597 [Verrucomicrobia subdivision 3 bacterium]|nr:hypothetical protein [Limisphaerales bacterium]
MNPAPSPLKDSPNTYPRLQAWSMKEYFEEQQMPKLPPLADPFTGKPMAQATFWAGYNPS